MSLDYRFEYAGEMSPEAKPATVKLGLAKLFSVDPKEIDPLLNGKAVFIREPIPEFTARKYQEKFRKLGAIGYLSESKAGALLKANEMDSVRLAQGENVLSDAKRNLMDTDCCPKCQAKNIDQGQCSSCGIYVEKYRARMRPNPVVEQAEEEADVIEDTSEERRSGIRWISLSVTALYALIFLDSQISDFVIGFNPFGGLGVFPYILVHFALVYGCIQYATAKGYNPLLGFIGMFSLAGLSVLLVAKDRDIRFNANSFKQWVFALFCIGYSVYWSVNQFVEYQRVSAVLASVQGLSSGREVYPSDSGQQNDLHYSREHDELHAYLKETLELLKQKQFSVKKQAQIAEMVMQSIAQYELWKDYQTYLLSNEGLVLPDSLNRKRRRKDGEDMMRLLRSYFDFNGEPSAAKTIIKGWFIGDFSPFSDEPEPWYKINNYLNKFDMEFLISIREEIYEHEEGVGAYELNFTDKKDYPVDPAYKVTMGKTTVRIDFKNGPYRNRFIKLGYYPLFEEKYSKRRFAGIYKVMIDTDVPLKKVTPRYNGLEFIPIPELMQ